MSVFVSAPRAVPPPPDQKIGERFCSNCGEKLFAHCEVPRHYPPCCPGQCKGPRTDIERLLASMLRRDRGSH